ncbi:MAG: cupin [Pseudomonadota bacterium]
MRVVTHLLERNGAVPNNPHCALLFYASALAAEGDLAAAFERCFDAHAWPSAWRNGVFGFHHYHSNAHEVLGIYSGTVTVRFGGDDGPTLTAVPGDVVVIPAGVAHKKLTSEGRLGIVGAYPAGQVADLCEPSQATVELHAATIAKVSHPSMDPVAGPGGPLDRLWPHGSPGP